MASFLEFNLKINISCQWEKYLLLAVWPHSLNRSSINIFDLSIIFTDHENLGKKTMFVALLCVV